MFTLNCLKILSLNFCRKPGKVCTVLFLLHNEHTVRYTEEHTLNTIQHHLRNPAGPSSEILKPAVT